jgi:ribosomal protein S18 acetylase RimI-like enzyme
MAEKKSLSAQPKNSTAAKLAPAKLDASPKRAASGARRAATPAKQVAAPKRALSAPRRVATPAKPAPAGKGQAPTPKHSAPAPKLPIQAARIRAAKASDLTALSLLFDAYRVFYRMPTDVKLARRFIGSRLKQKDSVIFVAENHARDLLGFVQLYPSFSSTAAAPIYVLNDLFVAPKGRQHGIGEALMQAAFVHAKKKGCARLDLGTERTNRTAQRLYEKQGYQKDTLFFHYSLKVK